MKVFRYMVVIIFLGCVLFSLEAYAVSGNGNSKVTLNVDNVSVQDVLQILAQSTHQNFIISEDIKGTMSVHFENVPWDKAFAMILHDQNLIADTEQGITRIGPASQMIAQEKQRLQQESDLSSLSPVRQASFTLQYGKAETVYEMLKNSTNTLLSPRGRVILDKRTNTLYIEDTEQKLSTIRHFLQKTDRPVQQVEIEARIVTIDKSFQEELGIQWNVQGKSVSNGPASATPGFNLDLAAGAIGTTAPGNLALATLSNNVLIDLELSALEAEGGGEILSSPRLLTADQQEALIEQGTEIPYSESTYSGGTAIAFKQAVLRLRVTPQISPNRKILLKLQVNQDAKSKDTIGVAVPIIDTRQISTNVLVNDGETVVLGGIYEKTQTQNMTRVPFLSAIPWIGELFKHRSLINSRKELLIFVTPRIVLQEP